MHMGILYLGNCNSNLGFPFHQKKACVAAQQLCSIQRRSRSNTQAPDAPSRGVLIEAQLLTCRN